MRFLIPILSIVCFIACSQDTRNIEFTQITLIDTFDNELILDTANSKTIAKYKVYYIGNQENQITLDYCSDSIGKDFFHEIEYNTPNDGIVSIFVDTSRVIGSISRSFLIPPPPGEKKKKIFSKPCRGDAKLHPVFIKNFIKDTLTIGIDGYVPLILEAKDSLGRWQPIEIRKPFLGGAGNFTLPPKNIILTGCKLYDGNYKTKLRLVYMNTSFSNEFTGTINYSQFYN